MSAKPNVVVFVHGIFSDHTTFTDLHQGISSQDEFDNWAFCYFDYDFHQSIPINGLALAHELTRCFAGVEVEVTIVGHSMGGLVGRLALLQHGDTLPFVKRLIMLATPNHGTLHTSRMGLLAHLTREVTGKLWSVFSRKTGIKELGEIGELMRPYLNPAFLQRTLKVEYVTIPAYWYHEEASWISARKRGTSLGLRALNLAFEFSQAMPLWHAGLERPHDGIVEEKSVFMGDDDEASRFSERTATCNGDEGGGVYLHIKHMDYRKEDHVTVQRADRTIEILKSLLDSPRVADWRRDNSPNGYSLKPRPVILPPVLPVS
jgi:pimeloyl-ACP methyl ester carboxylesterase